MVNIDRIIHVALSVGVPRWHHVEDIGPAQLVATFEARLYRYKHTEDYGWGSWSLFRLEGGKEAEIGTDWASSKEDGITKAEEMLQFWLKNMYEESR